VPRLARPRSATDQHGLGLTVRWVPKKPKSSNAKPESSRRFNFSTISANTRRHPIIANLSKTSLSILDTYKMPDLSTATPTATPKQHATILEDGLDSDNDNAASSKQEVRTTDENLRSIISMTSIYVAFKEGWSPYFKYDEQAPSSSIPEPDTRHVGQAHIHPIRQLQLVPKEQPPHQPFFPHFHIPGPGSQQQHHPGLSEPIRKHQNHWPRAR
jgi:hypothetical protein